MWYSIPGNPFDVSPPKTKRLSDHVHVSVSASLLAGVTNKVEVLRVRQSESRSRGSFEHVVENMEITLSRLLRDNSRLLQQILGNLRASNVSLDAKLQLCVLPESTRIMIHDRFGVAKCLQERIDLDNFVFKRCTVGPHMAELDDMLDHILGRLCLAGTGFATS